MLSPIDVTSVTHLTSIDDTAGAISGDRNQGEHDRDKPAGSLKTLQRTIAKLDVSRVAAESLLLKHQLLPRK
jgi:hypothetical protein